MSKNKQAKREKKDSIVYSSGMKIPKELTCYNGIKFKKSQYFAALAFFMAKIK